MSDLISRQAAIDALAKFVPHAICDESTQSYTNGLTDAYNLILQLPSAQPEIIRCKDCKFLRLTGNVWKCQNRLVMMLCEPNDYCSRAERKEE